MKNCIILCIYGEVVYCLGDCEGIADRFTEDEASVEIDKRIRESRGTPTRYQMVTLCP